MFPSPTLTVDLAAITANWQTLRTTFQGQECGAVVKADAYGLGAIPVARALADAGCHTFFVATLEEGLSLREALPDVRILVFHGVQAGEEFAFAAHRLIPILNSAAQIARWKPVAAEHIHAVSALHIDTAMGRLGLQPEEFATLLAKDPSLLEACRVGLIMSHLACAPESDHPLNATQLTRFTEALKRAPGIPASLCNSGGIFLPKEFHFHLARPGCSLYGIAPQTRDSIVKEMFHATRKRIQQIEEKALSKLSGVDSFTTIRKKAEHKSERKNFQINFNPMRHTATWHAPILMTRTLEREQTIGYGATVTAPKGTRIATVMSGYADGYLRHLSNRAVAYVGEHRVPLLGRVTMDMLCFDVTQVPESLLTEGAPLTLLGDADGIRVDDVADAAGTIGYEILTRIGPRVKRIYI